MGRLVRGSTTASQEIIVRQNYLMQNSLAQGMFLAGGRGAYAGPALQGPLAYLEKTATNIGRGASPEYGGSMTPP
ncbi:unnamed protein product, partial [Iphiclides podalirius]